MGDAEEIPVTRSWPRGFLSSLLMIAWSLSVVSISHCSFVKAKYQELDFEQQLGLFKFDAAVSFSSITNSTSSGYCARYDDESFDFVFNSAGRSARAFGVLAALLSGLAMALNVAVELFLEWNAKVVWRICAALICFASLFQALTFLVLLVEPCDIVGVDCTVDVAGYLSAISVVFLIACFVLMCCIRPPTKPFFPISDMKDSHNVKLRWIIFVLSILTWILSVIAVADCTFVRIGPRDTQYRDLSDVGLFSFNYDSEGHRCLAYGSSVTHDAATKTAQAFACLASILTGFVMLQVISLQLFLQWKTHFVWKMIRVEVLAATFSQAIVFAGFATEDCVDDPYTKCLPGPAGIINAINVLLLAVLSWLCWGMAPPAKPIFEVKRVQTENSLQDVENEVVSALDMAPLTIDEGTEAMDAWGVTAQRPQPSIGRSISEMAVYSGSDHKTLGSPTRDSKTRESRGTIYQNRGPDVQMPVMRESPGADPVNTNDRRGQIETAGVYEDEEYVYQSSQLTDPAKNPHRHHHHKKKSHRPHTRDTS